MPPALSIDVDHPDSDTTVVTVAGIADLATLLGLQLALRGAAAANGHAHLLVDLEMVTFMDATTLSALADVHRRISATGGTLEVRCLARHRPLLTLTGLGCLLEGTGTRTDLSVVR